MQSTSLLYGIIIAVMLIAGRWRMFTKAGEAGWKALVPIYSDIILFKLVWDVRAFIIYAASFVGFIVLYLLSGQVVVDAQGHIGLVEASNGLFAGIAYALSLVWMAYSVMFAVRTSYAYGKGAVFGFGMLILPNLFSLILGFGDARYRGRQQ